jgi:hypothetical protein
MQTIHPPISRHGSQVLLQAYSSWHALSSLSGGQFHLQKIILAIATSQAPIGMVSDVIYISIA